MSVNFFYRKISNTLILTTSYIMTRLKVEVKLKYETHDNFNVKYFIELDYLLIDVRKMYYVKSFFITFYSLLPIKKIYMLSNDLCYRRRKIFMHKIFINEEL